MKSTKEFPFHLAYRVGQAEVKEARSDLEKLTGKKRVCRVGRPVKPAGEKYVP